MGNFACYRFGNKLPEFSLENNKIRTIAKRKLKSKPQNYLYLGVDARYAYDEQGKHELVSYAYSLPTGTQLVVLTIKEKELIINSGFLKNIVIHCFEQKFSFFKNICYIDDCEINYRNLLSNIKKSEGYHLDFNYLNSFYISYHKKLCRKIPYKSSLDNLFMFFPIFPYQEVFKYTEEDQDRAVVALDFNSMYSSVMLENFLDPKNLEYEDNCSLYTPNQHLRKGMYFVTLRDPDEFAEKFHAMRNVRFLKSFPFIFGDQNVSVETILSDEELEFYGNHFKYIYIKSSITSRTVIKHPLASNCRSLYQKRKHFKGKNDELAGLHKFLLTILHSVSNSRKICKYKFHDTNEAISFLDQVYGIQKSKDMDDYLFLMTLDRNGFEVDFRDSYLYLSAPLVVNSSNIYSLYSSVIAKSRVKMMKTIECLIQFPNVEICYTNVDSIHVSLCRSDTNLFIQYLNDHNLIGDDLGKLKIESQSNHGCWFFPGRYWLYNSNADIVQFKNINLNLSFIHSKNIAMHRNFIVPLKLKGTLCPVKFAFNFKNTCYLRKKLQGNKFVRMTLSEINDETFVRKNYKMLRELFLEKGKYLKNMFKQ